MMMLHEPVLPYKVRWKNQHKKWAIRRYADRLAANQAYSHKCTKFAPVELYRRVDGKDIVVSTFQGVVNVE